MPLSLPSALMAALDDYVTARDDAIAKARRDLGVSDLEAAALARIGEEPGIRPSVLRGHLGVTAAGVTTLVDRLIGRGLLRRELDEQGRRGNHNYFQDELDAAPRVGPRRFPPPGASARGVEAASVVGSGTGVQSWMALHG